MKRNSTQQYNKTIISIFVFLLLNSIVQKGFGQSYHWGTNLESNFDIISLSPATNNIWEIGTPSKTFFDSANSFPHAILTDTINPYTINQNSSFVISLKAPNTFNINLQTTIDFDHKFQTTAGLDGGSIEVSYDSVFWQNVLLDTIFANNAFCMSTIPIVTNFYSDSDTLFNGQPGFSGTSNGWIHSSIFWCWGMVVGPEANMFYPDSMYVRFTFYSDSVSESLDGWMIDNIVMVGENPGSVDEVNSSYNQVKVYPQPAYDKFNLELRNNEVPETYSIFNIQGSEVLNGTIVAGESISTGQLSHGYYLLKCKTVSGKYTFGQLIII